MPSAVAVMFCDGRRTHEIEPRRPARDRPQRPAGAAGAAAQRAVHRPAGRQVPAAGPGLERPLAATGRRLCTAAARRPPAVSAPAVVSRRARSSCACAVSGRSTTPRSSWARASPRSPARPARARRCCSPGWRCCSAAAPTPALVRAGHRRAEVEGRFRVDPDGRGRRRWSRTAGGDARRRRAGDRPHRSAPTAGRGPTSAAAAVPVATLAGARRRPGHRPRPGRPARPAASRRCSVACSTRTPARPPPTPLAAYRSAFAELGAVQRRARGRHRPPPRTAPWRPKALRRGLAEIDAAAPEVGRGRGARGRVGPARPTSRRCERGRQRPRRAERPERDGSRATSDVLGAARRGAARARGGARATTPELDALAARVAEASYLLADVAADLAAYVDGIDADPARLAAVQDRLSRARRAHPALRRRHRRGAAPGPTQARERLAVARRRRRAGAGADRAPRRRCWRSSPTAPRGSRPPAARRAARLEAAVSEPSWPVSRWPTPRCRSWSRRRDGPARPRRRRQSRSRSARGESTRSSSSWSRTPARRPGRCTAAHPAASCRG